jgi:hypothetical protein
MWDLRAKLMVQVGRIVITDTKTHVDGMGSQRIVETF